MLDPSQVGVDTQLGPYHLRRVVGIGGMGTIYEALDTNLNRIVAVKVLKAEIAANEDFLRDFAREAEITASINHPNVVQVYHFGSEGDVYYLVMELMPFGSLDDRMMQGPVGEIDALDIGIQASRGLQEAHARGLLHRDVKPGNILFTGDGTVKIVDFGLSLPVDEAKALRGEVWGTPYYVAPEKLDQKGEDLRSDIYSLGGTLFHAIAGRPPFEAATASLVAWKHLKSEKVSLKAFAPFVANETAFVINRCLERDPERRYQSYHELLDGLAAARKTAIASPRVRKPEELDVTGATKELSTTIWFFVGTLVVLLVLVALFFVFRHLAASREDPLKGVMRDAPAAIQMTGVSTPPPAGA
ncbi:MAG: serine/threonine protein kinase [Verrucomicrobiae bacterium]|nr:serine/threonine protein kinase [Verrucomicrobiae bacterium]